MRWPTIHGSNATAPLATTRLPLLRTQRRLRRRRRRRRRQPTRVRVGIWDQVLDLVQVRIPGRRRGRVAGRARPGGSCKMASSLLSSPSSLSCDGFLAPLCCAHLFELFLFFGKPSCHKPCLPHERAICRRTPPAQSGNAGKGPRDPHGVPCEPDRGHDGGWRCAFAC